MAAALYERTLPRRAPPATSCDELRANLHHHHLPALAKVSLAKTRSLIDLNRFDLGWHPSSSLSATATRYNRRFRDLPPRRTFKI